MRAEDVSLVVSQVDPYLSKTIVKKSYNSATGAMDNATRDIIVDDGALEATDPMMSGPIPATPPYSVMRVAPVAWCHTSGQRQTSMWPRPPKPSRTLDRMLLRAHGPICAGGSIAKVMDRALELEETARLFLLLRGHDVRHLTAARSRS